MSTAIGKAALVLSTDAAGAKAGLDQFRTDAEKIAENTSKGVRGSFKSMLGGGLLLGAGAAIGGGLVTAIGGAISGAIGLKDEIDAAAKSARKLGIDTAAWQGISHAAGLSGVAVSSLESGLKKFQRGIDGPIDTALIGFARSIEGVTDPAERARMLVDKFGKAGQDMGTLFEGGADGLAAMIGEVHQLGAAVSDVDAGKVEAANDAIARAKLALTGVFQKALVAIAPVIQSIGDGLVSAFKVAQPIINAVGQAFAVIGEIASAVFTEVVTYVLDVVKGIGTWVGELFGLSTTTITVRDVVVGAFRLIGTAVALVWDTIKSGAGVIAVVFGGYLTIASKVYQAIIDLAKAIPADYRPKWVNTIIDGAQSVTDRVRGAGNDLTKWGKDAITGWGDSAVQFNGWLDRITKQQKAAAKKAAAETVAEAEGARNAIMKLDNAALIKGSSAEVSARIRAEFGGQLAADKLAENQKAGNKILEKIDRGINRLADKPGLVLDEL